MIPVSKMSLKMTSQIFVYLSLFISFLCVKFTLTELHSSYRAAVYEQVSISRPWIFRTPTKAQATDHMNLNLDIFEKQVKAASAQGAQVIVFPEYGVYGFLQTRDTLFPYLETVPYPAAELNPCDQPDRFHPSDYPVLHRLSCMAKNNSITIVANMGTGYNCSGGWSSENANCHGSDLPSDGRFQHNTDVALDNHGALLATYHKINLYESESKAFDPGHVMDIGHGVFNSSFGVVFGMLTCFDLLFPHPTLSLVLDFRIKHIIFPTAWMNQLPLLSAVEYQQSWARSFNVSLLASNQHMPLAKMTGSGIYLPDRALAYHYDMMTYSGKLLISDVPISQNSDSQFQDTPPHSLQAQKKLYRETVPNPDHLINFLGRFKGAFQQIFGRNPRKEQRKVDGNYSRKGQWFVTSMNDDPYTFVTLPLGRSEGRVSVCSNSTCCHLNYSKMASEGILPELYALGVYDSMHTKQDYYVQTCALVKCGNPLMTSSCGAEVETAHTRFTQIVLTGNFTSDPNLFPRYFPEVLTSGTRLAPQSEWSSDWPHHAITSEGGVSEPLLAAGIFGRVFMWD